MTPETLADVPLVHEVGNGRRWWFERRRVDEPGEQIPLNEPLLHMTVTSLRSLYVGGSNALP